MRREDLLDSLKHINRIENIQWLPYWLWYSPNKHSAIQRNKKYDNTCLHTGNSKNNIYFALFLINFFKLKYFYIFDNLDVLEEDLLKFLNSNSENCLFIAEANEKNLAKNFFDLIRNGLAHGTFSLREESFIEVAQETGHNKRLNFYFRVAIPKEDMVTSFEDSFDIISKFDYETKLSILATAFGYKRKLENFFDEKSCVYLIDSLADQRVIKKEELKEHIDGYLKDTTLKTLIIDGNTGLINLGNIIPEHSEIKIVQLKRYIEEKLSDCVYKEIKNQSKTNKNG